MAEHIIVYSRNSVKLKEKGVGKIALTGDFSNPDNDPRGEWASKPWKSGSGQSGTRYTIITPTGNILDEEWMGDELTYQKLLDDKRIVFPRGGYGMPRKKYYRFEREAEGQCACNWWSHEIYGNNQEASTELECLFGRKNIFNNPKPVKLIDIIINLGNVKENDIILDFFSGSATTAHAVMKINAEDNGKRKFIMVQLPEAIKETSEAYKAGYKTIDEIGQERIRRAAQKIKAENPETTADLGFKHYILQEPNAVTLDKLEKFVPESQGMFVDNDILTDFGTPTVLTTWLVRDGYGFNAPVQTINFAGYTAYYMDKHLYLIASDISREAIA